MLQTAYYNGKIQTIRNKSRTEITNSEWQLWYDYHDSVKEGRDVLVVHNKRWLGQLPKRETYLDLLETFRRYNVNEFILLEEAGSMRDFYNTITNGWKLIKLVSFVDCKVGSYEKRTEGYLFKRK